MNNNIELLEKYIPPDNPGYQFVKRVISYIPVREVGLSILIRKNQSLSFIYETVLSFLQIGINDISQLREALGLDIDVFKEIISKMAIEDLLFVSENLMGLTKKGEEALKILTKVSIEKTQLNRIFVNLVTGELYLHEPSGLKKRPLPSSMYLDEVIDVDINYYRDHFEHIAAIYESNLLSNILELESTEPCELYRILDFAYQETLFFPVACFVYTQPNSHEIFLCFDNDKDSTLMSVALTQIKSNANGTDKLFDPIILTSIPDEISDLQISLQNLLSIMQLRRKSKVSVQEIEEAYYCNRYLLEGEVRDLLNQCDEFKSSSIYISTPFLRRLFEDSEFIFNIANSRAKEIIIEYNEDEYKAIDSIKRLTDKVQDDKQVYLFPAKGSSIINHDTFILYPRVLIQTFYKNVDTDIPKKTLLKSISLISFDHTHIDACCSYYKEQIENSVEQISE